MRPAIFLGLAVSALACSRTPPEPAPAPPVSSPEPAPAVKSAATPLAASGSGATAVPITAGRCIAKMADAAPAIPPPAQPGKGGCPPDPETTGRMPTGEVSFPDAAPDRGSTRKITAELAKTPHDVERGLMYRRSMSDDEGMFFKLDKHSDHTFWMHNTCISLDMMFVDDDGLVVGIVEGATPLSEAVRSVGCESSYVLEVNGGWSRKHGVKPGQRITIPFSAR